jgi:hypothetical protein
MAIVTNKREVLSIEGEVKVIRQIENRKEKADVCWELGLVICAIQTIWENIIKVISGFEQNSSRLKRLTAREK